MSFLKNNWRVIVLAIFLVASLIFMRPQFGQEGASVSFISSTSPANGILSEGEIITQMNGEKIESANDVLKYYNMPVVVNGKNLSNFTGVDVKNPSSTNLALGLELVGGTRVVLSPTEKIDAATAERVISTLETRVNSFGLKDFKFQTLRTGDLYLIQVEIAGGTPEEVRDLLERQGKMEAKMPVKVSLTNGAGSLKLNSQYSVTANPTSAVLNGKELFINQSSSSIVLEGIEFEYAGINNSKAIFDAIVFSGADLEISKDTTRSLVEGNRFSIGLVVSPEGAERFAKITKDMPVISGYLDSQLSFFIDDNLISSYNVGSELKGRIVRDPSITGTSETQEEAIREKLFTESVLRSGALPVKLEIVKSDTISPSLGSEFIKSSLIAGLIALMAVFAVTYIRYRNLKISLLMNMINFSEVIILLGIASRIGTNIDLPAIAGIIAVVGTGINQLIIITDETQGKEQITLKAKVKRALFIIFGSAATLLAAMFPLMIIGLGAIKSFALMTILGVLVGVLVTRPAYAQIYERMIEKKID